MVLRAQPSRPGHVVFRVDSQTPKRDRNFIRSEFEKQDCRFGMPHSLSVASRVFESSITLPINGLVNTGIAIDPDLNGFLKLFLFTLEQNIQREGRAGRLFMSLYKTLWPSIQDLELPPGGDYEMPKYEALPLILVAPTQRQCKITMTLKTLP